MIVCRFTISWHSASADSVSNSDFSTYRSSSCRYPAHFFDSMARARYRPETDTADTTETSKWGPKRAWQLLLAGEWVADICCLSEFSGKTMRLPLPAHLRPGGIFHGYLASQQLVLFWHVIFDECFYDRKATKAKINWKSMLH